MKPNRWVTPKSRARSDTLALKLMMPLKLLRRWMSEVSGRSCRALPGSIRKVRAACYHHVPSRKGRQAERSRVECGSLRTSAKAIIAVGMNATL